MTKDYFRIYPTDIDFHAQISKDIKNNPFDKNDPRYNEWVNSYNKHHLENN